MQILLISGVAQSGKTHAAEWLARWAFDQGMRSHILPFAEPLKTKAAKSFGYDDWKLFKKERPDDYRRHCQYIGSEGRKKKKDYWVSRWMDYLHSLMELENYLISEKKSSWEHFVIADDARYLNELNVGEKIGAQTLFIKLADRVNYIGGWEDPWREHESEVLANNMEFGDVCKEKFDYVIQNDGDTDEFDLLLSTFAPYLVGITPKEESNDELS
jgi:hypothetical protein